MTGPANIEALRKIKDPAERALAAAEYIAAREQAIGEARKIRDDAIRRVANDLGASEAARRCGVSLSTVKAIRR